MRRLGFEPDRVAEDLLPVVRLGDDQWWVGENHMVRYMGAPEDFPAPGRWRCQCSSDGRCEHVANAIVVHAWNKPELRGLFEHPGWMLDLEALLDEAPPPPSPLPVHEGWVRYHLGPSALKLELTRELVRLSKRDGRELQALRFVRLDEVAERVHGITDLDREIDALLALYRRVKDDEVATRVLAQLLKVEDLRVDSSPVVCEAEPFRPVIEVRDEGPDVQLEWRPAVDRVWRIGPGYVLTEGGVFRPLAEADLAPIVGRTLPTIPASEAAAFLEQFALRARVPLDIESTHLPASAEPTALRGQVVLTEEAEVLQVDLRFGYEIGEDVTQVLATEPGCMRHAGGHVFARDPEREAALRKALESRCGPLPARMEGEQALTFVDGGLPEGPNWEIHGELRRFRVRGPLAAHVVVPSGIDWFDLQLDFRLDEQRVDGAAVLRSWAEGRRYHRLSDGTVAKLPESWLERHGDLGTEIMDLKRVGGMGLHAAPLIEPLLEQAEGDTTRWRQAADLLADFQGVAERELPEGLCAELRGYQHEGYRWLATMRDAGLGCCLADDMGLGKTVQALAALLDAHSEPGPPSLVVAPTSVIHNWINEAARFAPSLRVHLHHGGDRRPVTVVDADIIITSYALLRIDGESMQAHQWRYVILDEAQQIKNARSQLAGVARGLRSMHRLALTGTPLENHLMELWSIFEFLMPGFFGSQNAFRRRYISPVHNGGDLSAAGRLRRRVRPFVLRRLKREVAAELPERQEQTLYCDLLPEQRELYERVKATYAQSVLQRVNQVGVGRATLTVLEALTRLRQACCDPGLLPYPEAKQVEASAKLDLLMATLEQLVEAGHRALVFSQWPSLLKRVEPRLQAKGWTWLYLDGRTTRRQELVDEWNLEDGPPLFLISLKAGGAGLNLVGADHVVHIDPWWNPAVEDQATDRAHRIGQTRVVVAYKLVARNTVEEKILELQARKRELFEAAVERDRVVVEQLTRADLEAVFEATDTEAPAPLQAEPDDADICEKLQPGMVLTNERVRELSGWSAERARRWLRGQVQDGVLEQRGQKRGTHYVVRAAGM